MLRRLAVLPLLAGLALPTAASAAGPAYRSCEPVAPADLVEVHRAACGEAQALAGATPAELQAAGWQPLRAAAVRGADLHDLVAVRRDGAALRLRRPGEAPDLDGFAAGRELLFAAARIVGGAPVPRGASTCTSAFLIRLPGGRLGGLSAAHCAGLSRRGRVVRRNTGLRRPPQPGIVLGTVRRILTRTAPLDALVLPVPRGADRTAVPVVDRGVARPPHPVAGTAALTPGRRVCFTGRTSGPDRCGRLRGAGARPAERLLSLQAGLVVRCTTVRAAPGDSGGPVYTAPRADGSVRAVGIVTLVVGRSQRMCFTPLAPVLDRLDARLATLR